MTPPIPPDSKPPFPTETERAQALVLYSGIRSAIELLRMNADESSAKNYVVIGMTGIGWPFDRAEIALIRPGCSTPRERVAKLLVENDVLKEHVAQLLAERDTWSREAEALRARLDAAKEPTP